MSLSSLQYQKVKDILAELLDQGVTTDEISASMISILGSDAMKSTKNPPEYLTISAADTAASTNFSTYTAESIQEVFIQNLSMNTGAYITFNSTESPTATISGLYIPPEASVSLENTDYIYFSAISEDANTVSIRITGLG